MRRSTTTGTTWHAGARATSRAGTAVATVLTATAAVLAMTGCSGADAAPAPHRATTPAAAERTDVSEYLEVLRRPFAATDALPEQSTVSDDSVVPNSQRLVGTVDGTTYWVAAGTEGGACLIAAADEASTENWTVCGGNAADGSFVGASSAVIAMDDDHGHRTTLVTDGFTDTGRDAMHQVAPNVWAS